MARKSSTAGFSTIGIMVVVVVLAVVGLAGWQVYRSNKHKQPSRAAGRSSPPAQTTPGQDNQLSDLYSGWKTECDPAISACYKQPSDWVASPYGGYQNKTNTAYFRYQSLANKDQAASEVYVARIEDLSTGNQGLKIVGYVLNNVPTYVIYDATVVSGNNLAVGQTVRLVTTNPIFTGKSGKDNVTFVATPGATGIANITSDQQAKAWFDTPEAKQCLDILRSFYYKP